MAKATPAAAADISAVTSRLASIMDALKAKKSRPAIEAHRLWPLHEQIDLMKSKMGATYDEIAAALSEAGLPTSSSQVAAFWTAWKGKTRRRSARGAASAS